MVMKCDKFSLHTTFATVLQMPTDSRIALKLSHFLLLTSCATAQSWGHTCALNGGNSFRNGMFLKILFWTHFPTCVFNFLHTSSVLGSPSTDIRPFFCRQHYDFDFRIRSTFTRSLYDCTVSMTGIHLTDIPLGPITNPPFKTCNHAMDPASSLQQRQSKATSTPNQSSNWLPTFTWKILLRMWKNFMASASRVIKVR